MSVIIGTAGWSIPAQAAHEFGKDGTSLQRYAARLKGVEINSSFYRPHRPSTWARWADSVPADFRFAVKIPKEITHRKRLVDCTEPLAKFASGVSALGPKLSVLLVQLPPKLSFEKAIASEFFERLADLTSAQIVCEPRNLSWFEPEAEELLLERQVARAATDPAISTEASLPSGWRRLAYWRLHGSPVVYRSAYGVERLSQYAEKIRSEDQAGHDAWCIFDNTASGAAAPDAVCLDKLLGPVRA